MSFVYRVEGLSCLVFVCPGFVVSDVFLSRVCDGTVVMITKWDIALQNQMNKHIIENTSMTGFYEKSSNRRFLRIYFDLIFYDTFTMCIKITFHIKIKYSHFVILCVFVKICITFCIKCYVEPLNNTFFQGGGKILVVPGSTVSK